MTCRTETSCSSAENRRLKRFVQHIRRWRMAARDHRALLALDDWTLRDIGVTREEVLIGLRIGDRLLPSLDRNPSVKTMLWTVVVVVGSLAVAAFAAKQQPADPLAVASCALFHAGIMGGSPLHKTVKDCN
jgi:uncharacterized protein YjiS (DUF1127 family)